MTHGVSCSATLSDLSLLAQERGLKQTSERTNRRVLIERQENPGGNSGVFVFNALVWGYNVAGINVSKQPHSRG